LHHQCTLSFNPTIIKHGKMMVDEIQQKSFIETMERDLHSEVVE